MNATSLTIILCTSMVCLTGLVWHGDLPGHVLISGAVAIVAWLSRTPIPSALEQRALMMLDKGEVKP